MLEAVHLKAVALEDDLCARLAGDALEDGGHAGGIQSGDWHEDVEVDGQEPKGSNVELAGLRGMSGGQKKEGKAHQLHDGAACALDIDAVVAKDTDKTGLAADGGKVDKGAIVCHDRLEFVEALEEHPVELAGENGRVAGYERLGLGESAERKKDNGAHLESSDLEEHVSGALDAEKLSSDPDRVEVRFLGGGDHVCVEADEGRGEVYIGGRLLLDGLDDGALAGGNDGVELVVNVARVGVETGELVDHDEETQTGDGDGLAGAADDELAHALWLEAAPGLRVDAVGDGDGGEGRGCVDDGNVGSGAAGNVVEAAADIGLEGGRRGGRVEDLVPGDLDGGAHLHGAFAAGVSRTVNRTSAKYRIMWPLAAMTCGYAPERCRTQARPSSARAYEISTACCCIASMHTACTASGAMSAAAWGRVGRRTGE